MVERLLELSIYGLTLLIIVLVGWVIFRELLKNLRISEKEIRTEIIRNLFKSWLGASPKDRPVVVEKLKALGTVLDLEDLFFEFFEKSSDEEKEKLQSLFELIGIQKHLRVVLKESPDTHKREEAVLKLSRVAIPEDLPFLLDVFGDPDEHPRVKQCAIEAIYELSLPILQQKDAVANFGLLIHMLDIPSPRLQEHLVQVLSTLPLPIEDILPHFLRQTSDTAKSGFLSLLKIWKRTELAPLIHDYIDDLNPEVRAKAIELCGEWKVEETLLMLQKHLDDPEESVRLSSVEALSHFKNSFIKKRLLEKISTHPGVTHPGADSSVRVQAKIFWVLAIHDKMPSDIVYPLLIKNLEKREFRKEFFSQMSHEKREHLVSFFRFLGLDSRLFFKRFGWGDFDHCYDAFVMTAKESQDPELRKKAMRAISLWEGESATQDKVEKILSDIIASDPDHQVQQSAKKLIK